MSGTSQSWLLGKFPRTSLAGAGLVVLAYLSLAARRTVFTGTAAFADILILCPGLHRQQDAPDLNRGEYPICAAMTTGYVFRVENEATVTYLQKVGRTGHLTTLTVSPDALPVSAWARALRAIYDPHKVPLLASAAYILAVILTLLTLAVLTVTADWWGVTVIGLLVLVRLINTVVLRRRAKMGWKGESEPSVQSDLIVLLSQDRWIRIRGATDDVKAVTSGQWLREPSFVESALVAFATLLVYLDAGLAGNMSPMGQVLLVVLLFCEAGLLGLVNECGGMQRMYGRTIEVDGERQAYKRRLVLAKSLVKETGRTDWAIRLGMGQEKDFEGILDDDGPGSVKKAIPAKVQEVLL